MATSLYKAQFALRLCDQHDKKELNYYCRTCKKTVCTNCVKSEHSGHDWELISEYVKEKRRQLPKECNKLQNTELVVLERKIEMYETKLRDNEKEFEKNEGMLVKEKQNLTERLNVFFKEELTKCKNYSDCRRAIYQKERDELKKKLDYLQMMTNALKTDLATFSDHDIIEMEDSVGKELETAVNFDPEKHIGCSVFTPGDLQMTLDKIGKMHTLSLKEVSSFKAFSSAVSIIIPLASDKTAWVRGVEDTNYHLLSEKGEKLQTLTHSGPGMDISNDGNIVLIQNHIIKILDDKEEVIKEIDMKPLFPMCMAMTGEGDILVSLSDGGALFELDLTSRRIVRHMTASGRILHTYEFKNNSKARLFKSPRKVVENKNTDVCVINRVSSDEAELIVLSREGNLKFCFRGTDHFDPWDVECDSNFRILIADIATKSLFLLNSEGIQLSVLHVFDEMLCSVSLKNDRLWCGFADGSITVYQYK